MASVSRLGFLFLMIAVLLPVVFGFDVFDAGNDVLDVNVSDTIIYHTGYYRIDNGVWESFALNGDGKIGDWIISSADTTLNSPSFSNASVDFAIYSCSYSSGWNCHNGWQLKSISLDKTNELVGEGIPWSEPNTWPDGSVPGAGEIAHIGPSMKVLLDISPPELIGINISGGKLEFARKNLNLTAKWIMATNGGEFRIGSEEYPFEDKAIITLTGSKSDPSVGHCGTKVLCSMGSNLELHGKLRSPAWTRLADGSTAGVGDTSITLKEPVDWISGDEIVIVSTDYDPGQAEKRIISSVSNGGRTVHFNTPLKFMHYDKIQEFSGYKLDERAEVMLLTRNIVIQGSEDVDGFGGHVMAMNEHHMKQMKRLSNGEELIDLWQEYDNDLSLVPHITGVEFKRMGQTGILARYPWHWHLYGDASGSYVKDSSVHDSLQRCYTIHGTQNALLENNVAFNIIGHCYFLEDGAEWDNILKNNIGAVIRNYPDPDTRLIESDNRPSVFWWSNANNDFIGNVAAGSFGFGFWLDPKEHPDGPSTTTQLDLDDIGPGDFGVYRDNVVHSTVWANMENTNNEKGRPSQGFIIGTGGIGFMIGDREPDSKPGGIRCTRHHRPEGQRCDFINTTAYYNNFGGDYKPGRSHSWVRPVASTFADNQFDAYTHMGAHEEDNVFIGASDNLGNPGRWGDGSVPLNSPHVKIDDLNSRSLEVGRNIVPHFRCCDGDIIRQWGLNWQYDGGFGLGNVFINYEDDEHFDRGAMTAAGNTHGIVMLGNVLINAEPFLPQSGTLHGIVIREDGTLTNFDQPGELRQQPDHHPFLYDETCTASEGGENYQLCTGVSGLFQRPALNGIRHQVAREVSTGKVGNFSGFVASGKTYQFLVPPAKHTFYTQLMHTPQEAWFILAIPLSEPYSPDPDVVIHGMSYETKEAVTEDAFCDSTELITLYHDPARQLQYIKLFGNAVSRVPPFEYYGVPNPFSTYHITFDSFGSSANFASAEDIVTC